MTGVQVAVEEKKLEGWALPVNGRVFVAMLAAVVAIAVTGAAPMPGRGAPLRSPAKPITLIFTGDVMLGRGVAPLAAAHPSEVFGGVEFELSAADLTVGNLE